MDAIAEIGPIGGSGLPWAVTRRIEPVKEVTKLPKGDRLQRRRKPGAEILAELKMDGRAELDRHQVQRHDLADEPLRFPNQRVDGEIDERASPENSEEEKTQPNEPSGIREEGFHDAIPRVAGMHDARVECLGDLGLETRLLMEGDLEVGEQDELRPRDRVDFEARPVVASE